MDRNHSAFCYCICSIEHISLLLCVFDNTALCSCNMCVIVWTIHSASMCTQQVSFPDSSVRRWLLLWELRDHNDISFRKHASRHYGTTQRHLWSRGRESIMLDTFIVEGCALLPSSYILLLLLLLFLDWCLYSRLICLPDHQRASMAAVAWVSPALPMCSSFMDSLSSFARSSTNALH